MKIIKGRIQPSHPMAPKSPKEACERLLGLSRHLERRSENHGNPPRCHKRFDFAAIAFLPPVKPGTPERERTPKRCGTVGCAVGELPYCFPKAFRFNLFNLRHNRRDVIYYRGAAAQAANLADSDIVDDIQRAAIFFGLTAAEAKHLFIPNIQDTEAFGGDRLDCLAGPYDVASNIRQFCLIRYPKHYTNEHHEAHIESFV